MPGYTTVQVTSFDVAPNGNLIAGGWFQQGTTIDNVVEWDGTAWRAIGTITDALPQDLAVLSNGDIVAGCEALNGSGNNVMQWNGVRWSLAGGGVSSGARQPPSAGVVYAVEPEASGSVAVIGIFSDAGGLRCNHMARWDGTTWSRLATGTDDVVDQVLTTRNGDVLACGSFTVIEAVPAAHIARWDGATWSPLGGGTDGRVRAVIELPNGDLVAAGDFTTAGGAPAANIARWDGGAWSPLGSGTDGTVRALAALPNGDLVAGGLFSTAGSAPAANIARWNGIAWSGLGAGVAGGSFDGSVIQTLVVLANGDLCAGGHFATAGGATVNGVARWSGGTWSGFGSGMTWTWLFATLPGGVHSLLELPNGDLVAAGLFDRAGGVPVTNVARWNGTAWQTMGTIPGYVRGLLRLPDGDLLAGALELRRWSGVSWNPLAGTEPGVTSIALRPNGELMLGGTFQVADHAVSAYVARVATTCRASSTTYGSGCAGSAGPQLLVTTAEPWLGSTFRGLATGMPTGSLALVLWGLSPVNVGLPAILPQGVPGCALRASPDWWEVLQPAGDAVATQLSIPNASVLIGASAFHQVVAFELSAAGIVAVTSTNGLQITFGDL
ncbi:MAG: hypothetical protein IPM29_06210 [Planctomycetes bacterium]|nr:hypothetical protein [Planctomycetota bacterium]